MTRPSGSNARPGLGIKHDESDHALDPPDGDVVRVPLKKRAVGRPRLGAERPGVVVAYALVDRQDAYVVDVLWRLTRQGYAESTAVGLMHRHILGLTPGDGLEVDHINGDKLDCRRQNMRVVSHPQNTENVPARAGTSKYRGVSWDADRNRWAARAQVGGRQYSLGRHATEEAAHRAAVEGRARLMTHHNEARSVAHV